MDYNKISNLSLEISNLACKKDKLLKDIDYVKSNDKYRAWIEFEHGSSRDKRTGSNQYSISRESLLKSMENEIFYLNDSLEQKKIELHELLKVL